MEIKVGMYARTKKGIVRITSLNDLDMVAWTDKIDIQEEYETYETDEIRCPHCEKVYSDDLNSEYEADGDVFECPCCGEEFILSAYTSTSFTAIPTKEQIDEIYNNRNDRVE